MKHYMKALLINLAALAAILALTVWIFPGTNPTAVLVAWALTSIFKDSYPYSL